jgi:hypothetical protein
MLPPQTPVDQRLGATSRCCSPAACTRRRLFALSRAEARELAELLATAGLGSNLALLREALLQALGDSPP